MKIYAENTKRLSQTHRANYMPPPTVLGSVKTFSLRIDGAPNASVEIWRLDEDRGNVVKAYDGMGRPDFPTREQIIQLSAAGQPSPPENSSLKNGGMTVKVPPQGLVLVRIAGGSLN